MGCAPIFLPKSGCASDYNSNCRFLQNERGVLQATNAANCDSSNFSIVLRYSGGFATQLNILVCNTAHEIKRLDIPGLVSTKTVLVLQTCVGYRLCRSECSNGIFHQ